MNINAFIRLPRLEHAVMLCAAVLVGEIIALGQLPDLQYILLTFFPPFLIEIASFSINDLFDVDTDTANKRYDRPLVTGDAKLGEAFFISIAGFLVGVMAALLISVPAFVVALLFGAFAFLYSYKLKDMPLAGNIYIATTMAIPFIFGNLAVLKPLSSSIMLLALIAFMAGLGREILGTVRDMEGDVAARKSRTLPVIIGKQLALLLAAVLLIIAVILSVIPFTYLSAYKGDYNYLIPVAVADVLLLYVAARAIGDSEDFLSRARLITLAALGFGLIAFLLGAIY